MVTPKWVAINPEVRMQKSIHWVVNLVLVIIYLESHLALGEKYSCRHGALHSSKKCHCLLGMFRAVLCRGEVRCQHPMVKMHRTY